MNKYVAFYLQGRADAEDGISAEVDITAIALRVINGEKMEKATREAADSALRPKTSSGEKRAWLKENDEMITSAGGDKEKAYAAYYEGQVDEFRYLLEDETVDAMNEELEEVDDDGDSDEEDEDEDDDA